MYANYVFRIDDEIYSSSFRYSYISDDYYNVTWSIEGLAGSTWIEDKETRLISNSTGSYAFNDGSHAKLWIFTNLTLTNITIITVDGNGDFPFQVIDDFNYTLPGVGKIEVWVLENLIFSSTYAFYEKETGLLIYGDFFSMGPEYTLYLTDTNVFSHYQESNEIPGFNLFILIPAVAVASGFIIKKKLKK